MVDWDGPRCEDVVHFAVIERWDDATADTVDERAELVRGEDHNWMAGMDWVVDCRSEQRAELLP